MLTAHMDPKHPTIWEIVDDDGEVVGATTSRAEAERIVREQRLSGRLARKGAGR